MAIPKAMQGKYDEIAPLIIGFCDQKMDEDYRNICLRLLEKLCRKRPSPLLGGRARTWAAGIVYAIGQNNFVFDKSQKVHLTAGDFADGFGLAASTIGNKAAEIAKLVGIDRFSPEWMLPSLIRRNPMIWMLQIDGVVVDIRKMPKEIQQALYDAGVIPFLPDDEAGEAES